MSYHNKYRLEKINESTYSIHRQAQFKNLRLSLMPAKEVYFTFLKKE